MSVVSSVSGSFGSEVRVTKQRPTVLGDSAVDRILSPIASTASGFAVTAWGLASDVSAIARNCYWIQNPVNPDPGVVYGLGITSAMGVVTGPMSTARAVLQLRTAKKTNDYASATFAKLAIANGIADTAAGASMAVSRGLSLAGLKTMNKTMEVAGPIFGWAASITISLSFLLSAIRSLKTLRAALKFQRELNEKQNIESKFAYLLSHKDDPIQRAAYERAVGGKTLAELTNVNVNPAEIVAKVEADLKIQVFKQVLTTFAIVVGITSFIMTSVLTSGSTLVFGYAMMLVMNTIMTAADAQAMYQSMMNFKDLSTREKLVMAFFVTITIAATAAGIFFSGGAILGAPLFIGLGMLAVQGGGLAYAWHRHHNKPEKSYVDMGIHLPIGFRQIEVQSDDKDFGFPSLGEDLDLAPIMENDPKSPDLGN